MSDEITILRTSINLKVIFDNISESVLLIDKDGTVISYNTKVRDNVARYTNKHLRTGEDVFYYFERSGKAFFKQIKRKILSSEPVQMDHELDSSGQKVCFQFSINPDFKRRG